MTTDKIDTNNNSSSPPNFSLTLFEEFYEKVNNTQYKNDTYCKGEAPLFYKECGFTQHLNISYNKTHLGEQIEHYRADKINPYKNTQEEIEKHIISHSLPNKFWIQFEELLKDPIAVIPSNPSSKTVIIDGIKTKEDVKRTENEYLAILDYAVEYKDSRGHTHKDYVVVPFKDGINRIEGLEHPAMEVKSVYAKENAPHILINEIINGKLFTSNEKKYYINTHKIYRFLEEYRTRLSNKFRCLHS